MSPLVEAAIIAASAPTVAVIVSSLLARRKLQEIHVLVDGRLENVTAKLEQLELLRDTESEAAKKVVLDHAAGQTHDPS